MQDPSFRPPWQSIRTPTLAEWRIPLTAADAVPVNRLVARVLPAGGTIGGPAAAAPPGDGETGGDERVGDGGAAPPW